MTACEGNFVGRKNSEPCDECGHALSTHDLARACAVCQAVTEVATMLRAEFRVTFQLLVDYVAYSTAPLDEGATPQLRDLRVQALKALIERMAAM